MDIKENVRFIFCSFVPVGLEDYVDYMRDHFNDFIYFKWRFRFIDSKRISSSIQIFEEGGLINEERLFSFQRINNKFLYFFTLPLVYMFYLFQAIKNLVGKGTKDKPLVFMGVNYFCTFCGIILKYLGSVDFVIYRVMDFFPLPKSRIYRILHRIFYIIDRICLNHSDAIWFTTIGHIEGREKYGYFDRDKHCFEIIPLGVRQEGTWTSNRIREYSIVYCGNVSRYHMLDILFRAVERLKAKYPDMLLNIIGSGPHETYFRELAKNMGLNGNICFHGFIKDGKAFSELIGENSIGTALYRDEEDFIRYTEPAKVKTYLSCGVPVIVSDVPQIAKEIAENRVGFSIRNNVDELCNTLEYFFDNRELQEEYRNNILDYVKRFDINELLDKTFTKTFKKLGVL